ncbi:MAG: polysulfide reductase NrfD [Nitrospirae bacterium]|nr:polysulfide reductase NrfD [Nitrospirota bacterium]
MDLGHVHGELWTVKTLFTYPNEYIYWTIHIVIYPFITGLVAGAFVLSSLYHVFGKDELRPVAKFSLVFSLALLFIAPTPLLFHLLQPQRAINTMLTPHFYSAIAAFNLVYLGYMAIVISEIWFAYREYIVQQSQSRTGVFKLIYSALTLGSTDISEATLKTDHKIVKILAAIGIPAACMLHGYVGFIFGSVKTVPLWKTPLMPFIFLISAVISGVSICIVTYIIGMKLSKIIVDNETVQSMCKALKWFLVVAFVLEAIDLVFHAYLAEESWDILSDVLFERFGFRMFVVQWGFGMILPLILLTIPGIKTLRAFIAGALVLMGVFMMRWDVVIGGQSMSRSLAGFLDYHMPILPTSFEAFKEGLSAVIILLSAPFVLLYLLNLLFPVFQGQRLVKREPEKS